MKQIREEVEQMLKENRLAIYCSRCQMWFDTEKGWKAESSPDGLPLCPACLAPMFEMPFSKFKDSNKDRWEEVLTWEWPNGSFWYDKKDDIAFKVMLAKQRMKHNKGFPNIRRG